MAESGKQRNIRQTHQEREIIKTCPDIIVYLDGLPYVINPYIGDDGTLVNVNDYVTAVSGSCGLESYIPSASINLTIPNAHKRLFLAPGGNRILQTMMDVRIFAKGYYPTANGDTIYHRVFWGLVSSITYNDTGTSLEIDLSCKGAMRLLELMQINQAPALAQHGPAEDVTPFKSKFYSMNAFLSAFYMFVEPIQMAVLRKTSIPEMMADGCAGFGGGDTDEQAAFYLGYAPKWSLYLKRMLKGLRFYPFKDEHKLDVFQKWVKLAENHQNMNATGYAEQVHVQISDMDYLKATSAEFKELVNWAPDFSVGNISLFNSETVSRLERLRQMVDLIGYEGFQDLDGRIVVKPPLYNLDVCKWSSEEEEAPHNPYIVNLAEIEQESEQEDEGAVRLTRAQVRGTLGRNPLMQGTPPELLAVSSWIDLNLMRKFGLRTEEPKTYSFLGEDTCTNFAWAVNEMTKGNRTYRTYQCTIPMRPELKLGYPIFLPHMDMYGYLSNISWNYNVGGTATMRLHLDCIRERVLHRVEDDKQVLDAYGKPVMHNGSPLKQKRFVYKSLENLVFKFTEAKTGTDAPKIDSKISVEGQVGQPVAMATKAPLNPDVQSHMDYMSKDLKKLMQQEPCTPTKTWRIQPGGVTLAESVKSLENNEKGKGKYVDFSQSIPVNSDYYFTLRTTIPYTDNKGYTVLAPFPWGRHMGLRDALELFSMSSGEREARKKLREKKKGGSIQDFNEGAKQEKLNAFLFTATGTPSFNPDTSEQWDKVFNGLVEVQTAVLGDDESNTSADDDRTWFVMNFSGDNDAVLKSMEASASILAAKASAEKNAKSIEGVKKANASKTADMIASLVTMPEQIGK